MRGQGKHVKRSVWIGQSWLMSLLFLCKSRTNCLAFHLNSFRHQASAVSKFLAWYLLASADDWHFHGLLCSLGCQKSFTGSLMHSWPASLLLSPGKQSSPYSEQATTLPRWSCSTGVTPVTDILHAQSCNQLLNGQNPVGWSSTRAGFIFYLGDDLITSFSAQCFVLHLIRIMTSAALKGCFPLSLGIPLNQHFHRDFQSSLLTKKTTGLLQRIPV